VIITAAIAAVALSGRKVRAPVIDLHCHVLAGIDDGPESIEGSLALARIAAELGTRTIVATPHVSFRYRNDSATIARLVRETNAAIADAGLALDVVAGAEVALTRAAELPREELFALSLGRGPWVLLECPFTPIATGLDTLIHLLEEGDHRVILAHPERCPAFHRDPDMLSSLVQGGVLTSITAGALVGRFGRPVKRFALELADAEMIHNVASDAHDTAQRSPSMGAELEQSGLTGLAEWLTDAVPAAILAGEEEIPPRPRVAPTTASREPRWPRRALKRAW
jgi:protein-tyrosine phosphatase